MLWALGAMTAIDLPLIHAWATGQLSSWGVLGAHLSGLVSIAALTAWRKRRADWDDLIFVAAMVFLGPVGSPALLLGRFVANPEGGVSKDEGDHEVVEDSAAETVYAMIRQNRRPPDAQSVPQTFAAVLESGTLAQQQAAVASISRYYDPRMLPALKQALDAPIPAIRVQSAAVYAKLRGSFSERAKAILSADRDDPVSPYVAAEAREVAASGFVDAATAATLEQLAVRADQPPLQQAQPTVLRPALAPVPALRRYSCGGLAR